MISGFILIDINMEPSTKYLLHVYVFTGERIASQAMAGTHSNAKVDPHQSWSLNRRMGRVKIFQSTLNNGTLPAPLGKCWTAVEQSSKVQQGMEKRMLDRSLAEQSSKVWKNWLLTI